MNTVDSGYEPVRPAPRHRGGAAAAYQDDWRPGLARRADNFGEVCATARTWRWSPGETVGRVCAAILKGTPDLNTSQRLALALYAEHLNQERLEQNNACVWPSAALIAEYLGCSDRDARRHRRSLETAGYIVRDYNRANRPAGPEAFDLSPLMARLEEMEAADATARAKVQGRKIAYLEPQVHGPELSAQEDTGVRLEQSSLTKGHTVTGADAPSARDSLLVRRTTSDAIGIRPDFSTNRHRSGSSSAMGSSGGASGLGKASPGSLADPQMVRQEVAAAIEACPRLAELLPPTVLADAEALPLAIAAAAQQLLPDGERNNGDTARWGWRRHGPRVIAMLAIALEDTGVRSPCAYFGKLACSDPGQALDLRMNLNRILKTTGIAPAAAPPIATSVQPPPGSDDPVWLAIMGQLQQLVRQGAFGAWFTGLGFLGLADGVLSLSSPTTLAADQIRNNFSSEVRAAADLAGFTVEKLAICLRRQSADGPK